MIAYENGATQEMTPTATIIALVSVSVFASESVSSDFIALILKLITTDETVLRSINLLILVLALVLLRPLALNELKIVRSSSVH